MQQLMLDPAPPRAPGLPRGPKVVPFWGYLTGVYIGKPWECLRLQHFLVQNLFGHVFPEP